MVALLADTEDNVVYLAGNKHEFSFVKMRVPLSVCVRVYALRIVSRDKILRYIIIKTAWLDDGLVVQGRFRRNVCMGVHL